MNEIVKIDAAEYGLEETKAQDIAALYIEYMKAKKWDGKLPSTTLGSGQGTIVNLK